MVGVEEYFGRGSRLELMPGAHAQNSRPEPVPRTQLQSCIPGYAYKGFAVRREETHQNRALELRAENPNRPEPTRTDLGYHGLIRAEMQTYRMQADNIKRWGSIARPPPERLGMSGWERLSAEGRSKRLKIWSPGLPISNPTSCNHYLPEPP